MLSYYLLDNPVTPDPTDFRAQPVANGSKDIDDLVEYMIARGSTVTKAEAKATLQELLEASTHFLREGYNLNLPLFKAGFSITGVFKSEDDTFDPNRHQLNINLLLGGELKDVPQQIKLVKVEGNPSLPLPKTVFDVGSQTLNDRLTPGGTVKVTGKRMKIDASQPTQGVFLINGNKPVPVTTLVTSRPSELVMVLPTLPKGTYTLEVRGTVNGAERSGQLPVPLTVK
jgi:hypothetical protein